MMVNKKDYREQKKYFEKNIVMAQSVQLCTHKIQGGDKEHEVLRNSSRFHNNLYWNQVRMKVCLGLLDSYILSLSVHFNQCQFCNFKKNPVGNLGYWNFSQTWFVVLFWYRKRKIEILWITQRNLKKIQNVVCI